MLGELSIIGESTHPPKSPMTGCCRLVNVWLHPSLADIIVLEFTQSVYNASEGGGDVEVCLETDMELPEAVQVTILASEILSTDRFNRAIGNTQ